jgi:hypothetical protein
MNEPYANLNLIGLIAMTFCIVGLPWWLLGELPGRLYFVMIVFFVGMVWLSNRADEGL